MEESQEVDIEEIESFPTTSAEVESSAVEITEASSELKRTKHGHLPLSRIKNIMRMDPDLEILTEEAAVLVTKSTELFLQYISTETFKFTTSGRRKTVQKKDVDSAIDSVPSLCFLDGAITL